MPERLHNSKNCCTFAVDFGKVPITFFQLTEIALMVLTVDGIANTHS